LEKLITSPDFFMKHLVQYINLISPLVVADLIS